MQHGATIYCKTLRLAAKCARHVCATALASVRWTKPLLQQFFEAQFSGVLRCLSRWDWRCASAPVARWCHFVSVFNRFIQVHPGCQWFSVQINKSPMPLMWREPKRFQQVLTETNVWHFIEHHDHHGGIAHPMAMCGSWMPSVVADSAHVVKSASSTSSTSSTSSQEVMYVRVARKSSWYLNLNILQVFPTSDLLEYRTEATKHLKKQNKTDSTEFHRVRPQAQTKIKKHSRNRSHNRSHCRFQLWFFRVFRASFGLRLITSIRRHLEPWDPKLIENSQKPQEKLNCQAHNHTIARPSKNQIQVQFVSVPTGLHCLSSLYMIARLGCKTWNNQNRSRPSPMFSKFSEFSKPSSSTREIVEEPGAAGSAVPAPRRVCLRNHRPSQTSICRKCRKEMEGDGRSDMEFMMRM